MHASGVILFEAITGQLPVTGSQVELFIAKSHRAAVAVHEVAPDCAADLAELGKLGVAAPARFARAYFSPFSAASSGFGPTLPRSAK